jgi:hypothetical protein
MSEYYSPTGTQKYLDCPKLYDLGRRWQPQESISKWTPNIILGKAIAKGLEYNYKNERDGSTYDPHYYISEALEEGFVEQAEWTLEGLKKLALGGFQAALKTNLPLGGKVFLVEEDIGGFSPDLVYGSTTGELVCIDHKVTLSLKPEYVESRLLTYETSWQFAHYAWALSERYGEHVGKVGVHLIVLSPKARAYLHFVEFTPERLAMWHQHAEQVWWQMSEAAKGKLVSYSQNWQHCQKYGSNHRCDFYVLCHDLAGDESRAEAFYEKR